MAGPHRNRDATARIIRDGAAERMPDILTTGQVASLMRVAPRTVNKWYDAGFFPGAYRIPGSQDRRIPVHVLSEFCRKNGMPDPLGNIPKTPVHVVGNMLAAKLLIYGGPVINHPSSFALCLSLVRGVPSVIGVEAAQIGRGVTLALLAALKEVDRAGLWSLFVQAQDDDGDLAIDNYRLAGAKQVLGSQDAAEGLANFAWGEDTANQQGAASGA